MPASCSKATHDYDTKRDPKHVCAGHNHLWVALRRGSSIAMQPLCKTFLELHVKRSKRRRLTLRLKEFIIESEGVEKQESIAGGGVRDGVADASREVVTFAMAGLEHFHCFNLVPSSQ
jgi:hypothetical protein